MIYVTYRGVNETAHQYPLLVRLKHQAVGDMAGRHDKHMLKKLLGLLEPARSKICHRAHQVVLLQVRECDLARVT